MTLAVRRVVTGHDENGRAVVKIDEITKNLPNNRPLMSSAIFWTTTGFPVDNDSDDDTSAGNFGTTVPGGSIFRIIEYGPGRAPRFHRTDSIDYAIILSGEIDMELDEGESVHLKAGDVVVQRGTIHNWRNDSGAPCVIVFILIDAKPVEASGKVLNASG